MVITGRPVTKCIPPQPAVGITGHACSCANHSTRVTVILSLFS